MKKLQKNHFTITINALLLILMKNLILKLSSFSLAQKIFTATLLILCCLHVWKFSQEVKSYEKLRPYLAYQFIGNKFLDFKSFLENVSIVGYSTDRNLSATDTDKRFTQAQFILSPTVLDAHNTDYRYIILDCSTLAVTIEKMKILNVTPLKITPSGIILAERK